MNLLFCSDPSGPILESFGSHTKVLDSLSVSGKSFLIASWDESAGPLVIADHASTKTLGFDELDVGGRETGGWDPMTNDTSCPCWAVLRFDIVVYARLVDEMK